MSNSTKLIIIVLIYIFNTQSIYSQDNGKNPIGEDDEFTKIIPPSPTAYELGKYGQIPVGYFTGTPNVSVPIYTYKAGNLSVPISLSYNSNGIKVDQLSSNVGLGWSLNVGGVITRVVKDEPDEEGYIYFPESQISKTRSPFAIEYFTNASQGDKDSEADVFMYNFNGYSGKFVYNNIKGIVLIPAKNIEIEPFIIENSSEFGYRITTADGVIYEFTIIEKTKSFNQVQGKNRTPNIPLTTAWYLSKITHPAGDQINFIYGNLSYSYDNSISQSHYKSFLTTGCDGEMLGPANNLITYKNSSTIYGSKIAQITSNNDIYGTVNFQYNFVHPDVAGYTLISGITIVDPINSIIEYVSFSYLPTSNNRVFLSNLTYEDPTKQYNFDYIDPEQLCERLSYSQDYWGYYNNKPNQYFLPTITDHQLFIDSPYAGNRDPVNEFAQKGLLKKITYPTKGYNEFEYEPNTYFGDVTIYPDKSELRLDVFGGEEYSGPVSTFGTTETILFNHRADIHAAVWFDDYEFSCDNSHAVKAHVRVKDLFTNEHINILEHSATQGWYSIGTTAEVFEFYPKDYKVDFIKDQAYEIELTVYKPCHRASLTLRYYDQEPSTTKTEIETGGSRIKKILATDVQTNTTDSTRYYYNEYSNKNVSSGDVGSPGYYISNRTDRIKCTTPCDFIDWEYYVLQTNSIIPLINTGNNNIYYEYVTISHGGDNFENGGETHEFIIHRDLQGNPLVGDGFTQSPSSWTNFGWDNGLEESVRSFKVVNGELKTVSLLTNNYFNDTRLSDTVYSYAITKNFEQICTTDYIHTCTKEDSSSFIEWNECINHNDNHKHIWALVGGTWCIAPGANNQIKRKDHPCKSYEVGYDLIYPDALENLNIIEYMNLSSWNYLSSSTLREYNTDNSSKIKKTTHYYYDNPKHLQVNRIEKTESTATTESQIYYPEDYDEGLFRNLLDNKISNVPIDQRTIYNDKLQNGRLIHYNDIGQPTEIYNAEEEKGTDLGFYSNNPYSYANGVKKKIFEYDNYSNTIRSYKNEDDIETTILWGYSYTKPIAKIDNANFNQIEAALIVSYSDLQTKTSTELREIFNELRDNPLLENAMITSYTYDPLIGMTSTTDPNGYITHYIYDSFGRLQTIRDFDWNVIKHYNYSYRD